MRLIDADALIEYCNNQKIRTVDANDIARFPTVSGWISVKDRLPALKRTEDVDIDGKQMDFMISEDVLIFTPDGIDVGLLEDDGHGRFWTTGGCDCSVSYWMPIPELPK